MLFLNEAVSGCLKVIDRKSNIFKMAQGEFVSPEKVENICLKSPLVAHIFVDGRLMKSSLVAIVVPDTEALTALGKEMQIDKSFDGLCKDERMKALILESLTQLGKKAGLNSFELVKDIYVDPEAFSIEKDLLTPTFKMIRSGLRAHYIQQLDNMNANLP